MACRLAPSYWQTHVCVAQAALAAQRLDVATEAAARARGLAPNEPDVHFLSGKVSLARSDLAGAREHQERALALDPDRHRTLPGTPAARALAIRR